MNKTQFVILRGRRDSGKTTLCAEVYRQLLHFADKEHLFGKPECSMATVTDDSIKFDEKGNTCDFQALLTISNKKVGFFSMGDYVPDFFKINIHAFIEIDVDILVCCTRSRNRGNSTFRYIEETYAEYGKTVFWTEYSPQKESAHIIKQKQAEIIVQHILTKLDIQ